MSYKYRKDGTLYPCYDPNIPHPGMVFYGGMWRTTESVERQREKNRRRCLSGKYRSIGVAEKRAMLKAAGEEWPIGSDGLPKMWSRNTNMLAGGQWHLRSKVLANQDRYQQSEKGRATSAQIQARRNERRAISPGNSRGRTQIVAALKRWKKLSSPGNLRVLEKHDPRTAGLIKVAFGEGSTDNERLVAKRKLWAQQQGGRQTWQDQQTTSSETRNTPRETKSLPTSASSLGE